MGIFNSYDKLQGGNSELQTINISGMWWSGNIKLDQPSPYTFWVKKQPSLFSSKAWHLNDTLSHSWIMDGYSSYSQKNDNHRFWYPSSYNHKHGQLPNPKRFLMETAMEVTEVAFFSRSGLNRLDPMRILVYVDPYTDMYINTSCTIYI
jgi:hypothetical protein